MHPDIPKKKSEPSSNLRNNYVVFLLISNKYLYRLPNRLISYLFQDETNH